MPDHESSDSRSRIRRLFGRRLKKVRARLGHTQEAFARALGIQAARYNKYEIGRSDAPYDVLLKIARLGGVSLDYLLGLQDEAESKATSAGARLKTLIQVLPTAAVVYDRANQLFAFNRLYQDIFFPDCPSIVQPGVSQDTLVRAWAYANGIDPLETEGLVRQRLQEPPEQRTPTEIAIGDRRLQIAESRYRGYRLVLLTDVTPFRAATGSEA